MNSTVLMYCLLVMFSECPSRRHDLDTVTTRMYRDLQWHRLKLVQNSRAVEHRVSATLKLLQAARVNPAAAAEVAKAHSQGFVLNASHIDRLETEKTCIHYLDTDCYILNRF